MAAVKGLVWLLGVSRTLRFALNRKGKAGRLTYARFFLRNLPGRAMRRDRSNIADPNTRSLASSFNRGGTFIVQ
jgi:hypothetical protein